MPMPKRKTAKKTAKTVTFSVDGYEGEFELPKATFNFAEQKRLIGRRDPRGKVVVPPDISVLTDFLDRHDASSYVDLIDEMEDEEIGDFMEAWLEASGVDQGKSKPASS